MTAPDDDVTTATAIAIAINSRMCKGRCRACTQCAAVAVDTATPLVAASALIAEADWWRTVPQKNLTGQLVADILVLHARAREEARDAHA